MITRVTNDGETLQVLIIENETYLYVYNRKTRQIEAAYSVYKTAYNKTVYNPVQLELLDTKYLVAAYRKIKTFLENENSDSNR